MTTRIVTIALAVCLTAASALAQSEPKVEVGVFGGWVFSDGVSGDNFLAGDGNVYNRVDPADSFGWGIDVGFLIGPNSEVGFIYGNQATTLKIKGTATRDIGDQTTSTYHGYYAYNWGETDTKVRPYFLFGLGATSFGDVSFTTVAGTPRTIDGLSYFSGTIGVGAKFYGNGHIGGRVGMHWTPTYIKSDAAGYWCDPYWGCYLVGDPQYANQFSLNGGITLRF